MSLNYWVGNHITELNDNQVFVFGSNPAGINGAGAAKAAMKFGAIYGEGRGLFGQTYALVTKNLSSGYAELLPNGERIIYERYGRCSVSPAQLTYNIEELYECARLHSDKQFLVAYTNNTNNLNGYSSEFMFSLFVKGLDVPKNMYFHESFKGVNLE